MAARLPLCERYMLEEEREDDARIAANWRKAHPGRSSATRRSFAMWRAARRERREFRKAYSNYRRHVVPMAEVGHSIADSWYFLVPMAVMVIGVLLWQAGCFK